MKDYSQIKDKREMALTEGLYVCCTRHSLINRAAHFDFASKSLCVGIAPSAHIITLSITSTF